MITEIHAFGPFPHHITRDFSRVDLEIYGINHFRPTYTAWVFFNDPDVTEENASPKRPSFAGTFAVFGHSECWGTHDHCKDVTSGRRFDLRPSHPMTTAFRRVMVTRAAKMAVRAGDQLTITVVAKTREPWPSRDGAALLSCKGMKLSTFA